MVVRKVTIGHYLTLVWIPINKKIAIKYLFKTRNEADPYGQGVCRVFAISAVLYYLLTNN
ncbi:hypothetical protein Slin_5053 [Spirosoma linguale DSM 74]|uniref:Uncharacterized protein n=1 Tax=Spirosoma linguale (strain ATCC 33905 / DSM 74 / LMG 10896 / Claus 1) TaxID=504472 RepID=D2QD22_SPILD|nr:hypothetical protein Slin_5053 [Spirosoma linguale DSM 74]